MIVTTTAVRVALSSRVPSKAHGLGFLHLRHGQWGQRPCTNLLPEGFTADIRHILESLERAADECSVVQATSVGSITG